VGIESRDIKPEQSEASQFATFKHYVGLGKSEPANSLPSRKHPPDNVREGLFSLAIATLEAVGRIGYGIACYRRLLLGGWEVSVGERLISDGAMFS
jgi:hypothetical protein